MRRRRRVAAPPRCRRVLDHRAAAGARRRRLDELSHQLDGDALGLVSAHPGLSRLISASLDGGALLPCARLRRCSKRGLEGSGKAARKRLLRGWWPPLETTTLTLQPFGLDGELRLSAPLAPKRGREQRALRVLDL